MKNRCYSEGYLRSHSWYEGCTVCDEWLDPEHGFGRFCEWFNDHYYTVQGEEATQLDKDILKKGNTVYAPDNCHIVPKTINCMFSGSRKKSDNSLPKGVIYDANKQMYLAVLTDINGKNIPCKERYDTPEEAWKIYAQYRKCRIDALAESYRAYVPSEVYNAVKGYELDIND